MSVRKISFVVPLYNEQAVFSKLIARLKTVVEASGVDCEVVLIDDGSSDETPMLMASLAMVDPMFQCIFLSRNFGHQMALSAGLRYARGTEGVMIVDGDLQDPPELFSRFYSEFKAGFDVVYGVRAKRKENWLKRGSYFLFYRILSGIANTPISIDSGDFAFISRRAVNVMNSMPEDSRFLRGMRSWIGFPQKGIVYERESRAGGDPKYNISKLFKLAYDGIFNFSVFPLKFLTGIGVMCISLSVIYMIITVARKVLYNDVPIGFTALLFMIVFFGGVQLISIGIIGEYVSRTFMQVKDRPLFVVKSRIEDKQSLDEQ